MFDAERIYKFAGIFNMESSIENRLRSFQHKSDFRPKTISNLDKNRAVVSAYDIEYKNLTYTVLPGVFAPDIFKASYLFLDFFLDNVVLSPEQSFLEIGCGAGLVSINVAVGGCHNVVASDISPAAVKNTRLNSVRHDVSDRMEIYQSDVFSSIETGQTFDLIYWNMPFTWTDKVPEDVLEASLYDTNYRGLHSFVSGAGSFLKPDGKVLLGFSNSGGHLIAVDLLASKYNFLTSIVTEKTYKDGFTLQLIQLEMPDPELHSADSI